ncbi:MAG TPA: trypsin-like peptidase domain-containing protein [Streptosporangiaceae bacterium]
MMRENDSDGAGGWWQSSGHGSPGSPRDQNRDEGAGTRSPGPDATPASESDYPDTVTFGSPAGSSGDPGHRQAGSGQAWYESQGGYRNQGGYGNQDSYGNQGGGGGAPGWPAPDPPRGRSGRGGRLLVYVAVAAIAASIGAGATVAFGEHHAAPAAGVSSGDVPAPHENASSSGASSASLNPEAVRKKVSPGLVDIKSNLKFNGELAEGTGMIISASGLVLTNNHVIDGATTVQATLATSGQFYPAKVLGYDAAHDVALLQLQGASGLTPVSFGNSSQVRLGTPVLALGNAEGRGGATLSPGIINALDRSIQASDEGSNTTENLDHMLQTNAHIEQGDSGGALANNAGQVIGMITAANTGTSGQSSPGGTLGFAIPINSALAIARQIAAGQASATVHIGLPGFLGVQVAVSDSSDPRQQAADQAQKAGRNGRTSAGPGSCSTSGQQPGVPAQVAPIAAGALIIGVLCNSVAQAAGWVPGDVITSVSGHPVTTPGSLSAITSQSHPGDVVSVLWVSRDGVEHTTRMRLDAGPAR